MDDSQKLDQAIQAIDVLAEHQLQHLNRQLAVEAVLQRLIPLLDLPVLRVLREEFEQARDQAMAALEPHQQRPAQWDPLQQSMDEAIAHKQRPAGHAPG